VTALQQGRKPVSLLPFVKLHLYCRGDQEPLLRHPKALDVLARPRESDLEIAHICAEERRIEPVVKHLVAHPAETAAALLDTVKIGRHWARTGLREQGRYLPFSGWQW